MSVKLESEACPCDSGLAYTDCCGDSDRHHLNIIASISTEGINAQQALPPAMQAALDSIETSPDLFPARFNLFQNQVQWVKMSPDWYREGVFLDVPRILGSCTIESDLNWLRSVSERVTWQTTPLIFHTAFCGSTLMSKALDVLFDSLPLREPEALNHLLAYMQAPSIADQEKSVWFDRVLCLLSRRYAPMQPAVIKTNDCANGLMRFVLQWQHPVPILFMYTPLSEFLAGCLRADNRREWIRGRYQFIRAIASRWLNVPAGLSIGDESYGELAALYWAYNIALYQAAWRSGVGQLRSLDFNHLLASPLEAIQACGTWFDLKPREDIDVAEEMEELFSVYSKNTAYTYSPQRRRDDVDQLLKAHPAQLQAAEQLARELLADNYPEPSFAGSSLPGALI